MKLDSIDEQLGRSGIEVLRQDGASVACPATVEQAKEVLARAAEADLRVVPSGLGSKLGWCRPEVSAGDPLLVLSTRRMNQVLEYVAGDGTLTAQCGATMQDLAEHVSQGGHQLTPDVPSPAGATLGGVLGAGQSGIDRLLYGPVRHHVLGISALLSGGSIARSGGRLVKNVTGFDLHRLYTGSRGTLCVLLEASMRLFSIPEDERAFTFACADAGEARRRILALWQARLPALAMVVEPAADASGTLRLHLLLAGRMPQLDAAVEQVSPLLAVAQALTADAARSLRQRLRDAAAPEGKGPELRLRAEPFAVLKLLRPVLEALQEVAPEPYFQVHPTQGTADIFMPGLGKASEQEYVRRVLVAQRAVRDLGGTITPCYMPAPVHMILAPENSDQGPQRWMSALRQRFDPTDRFACPTFPVRLP